MGGVGGPHPSPSHLRVAGGLTPKALRTMLETAIRSEDAGDWALAAGVLAACCPRERASIVVAVLDSRAALGWDLDHAHHYVYRYLPLAGTRWFLLWAKDFALANDELLPPVRYFHLIARKPRRPDLYDSSYIDLIAEVFEELAPALSDDEAFGALVQDACDEGHAAVLRDSEAFHERLLEADAETQSQVRRTLKACWSFTG